MNLDDRIDVNNPSLETETFSCDICDTEISKEGICDSKACFKADNM